MVVGVAGAVSVDVDGNHKCYYSYYYYDRGSPGHNNPSEFSCRFYFDTAVAAAAAADNTIGYDDYYIHGKDDGCYDGCCGHDVVVETGVDQHYHSGEDGSL